jgi:hypothetical protein
VVRSQNAFELYIGNLDEGYLIGLEDFYTLPESIRERILATKRTLAVIHNPIQSAFGSPTIPSNISRTKYIS